MSHSANKKSLRCWCTCYFFGLCLVHLCRQLAAWPFLGHENTAWRTAGPGFGLGTLRLVPATLRAVHSHIKTHILFSGG